MTGDTTKKDYDTIPMTEDEREEAARHAKVGIERAEAATNPIERIFWAQLAKISAAKARAGVHLVEPLAAPKREGKT